MFEGLYKFLLSSICAIWPPNCFLVLNVLILLSEQWNLWATSLYSVHYPSALLGPTVQLITCSKPQSIYLLSSNGKEQFWRMWPTGAYLLLFLIWHCIIWILYPMVLQYIYSNKNDERFMVLSHIRLNRCTTRIFHSGRHEGIWQIILIIRLMCLKHYLSFHWRFVLSWHFIFHSFSILRFRGVGMVTQDSLFLNGLTIRKQQNHISDTRVLDMTLIKLLVYWWWCIKILLNLMQVVTQPT
jgi:hypothetical protein